MDNLFACAMFCHMSYLHDSLSHLLDSLSNLLWVCPFYVLIVTFPLYFPCGEYSDVCRWSTFQHRKMSNATPPAGKDLFSTVPCNSYWQKCLPVDFLAIRLVFPRARISVSQSCSKQLKTLSFLAGGVAFVPICCELCPISHELRFPFVPPNSFCPSPPGPTGTIFWSPECLVIVVMSGASCHVWC